MAEYTERLIPVDGATIGWLREAIADLPDDYVVKVAGDAYDRDVHHLDVDVQHGQVVL
jgi:hypothetical protein